MKTMAAENDTTPQGNPSSSKARPKQPEAKNSPVSEKKLNQIEKQIVSLFSEDVEAYRVANNQDTIDPEVVFDGVITQLARKGNANLVTRLKKILNVSESDDLSLDSIKDLGVRYDSIMKALSDSSPLDESIPESHQKAIAEAYARAMKKGLGQIGAGESVVKEYDSIVTSHKDDIHSLKDFGYFFRKFLAKAKLTAEQSKSLSRIIITYEGLQAALIDSKVATTEEIADMRRTGKIPTGNELEKVFGSLATLYGATALKKALTNAKDTTKEVETAYTTFPGLASRIASYKLTDDELKGDVALEEKIHNTTDEIERQKLRLQAALVAIRKKDPEFGSLLADMIAQDFNMTKVSQDTQQKYLESVKDFWLKSDAGKTFIGHLVSSFDIVRDDVTKMVDDLFDLGKKELIIKTKTGDHIVLHIQKHWLNESWNLKTHDLFMKNGLPLVFEISSDDIANDTLGYLATGDIKNDPSRIVLGNESAYEGNYVVLQHKTKPDLQEYGYLKHTSNGWVLLSTPGDATGHPLQEDISQYDVVEKKNTFIAPSGQLTNIVSALPLIKASSDMLPADHARNEKQITKDLLKKKLASEFGGIDEGQNMNTSTVDAIDWFDDETVKEVSLEDTTNAQAIYNKKVIDLSDKISEYTDARDHIAKQIQEIADKLNDPKKEKTYSASEKGMLEQKKKKLEKESVDLKKKIDSLTQEKIQAEKKRDRTQILSKKKQAERNTQDATDPNSPEVKSGEDQQGPKDPVPAPRQESDIKTETPDDLMQKERNMFQGDEKAPLKKGAVFFAELGSQSENILPGWKHPWVKAVVESYDAATGKVVVRWHGVDAYLEEGVEGKTSTIYGASGFGELKGKMGRIIKFPSEPFQSWKNWGLTLKEQSSLWKLDKEHKDYVAQLVSSVDFGSWYRKQANNVLPKDAEGNRIKYIGTRVNILKDVEKNGEKTTDIIKERVWFELKENKDGTVTLVGKDKYGQNYNRSFDPYSLLVFMMDKGLTTYTQNEVDTINTGGDDKDVKNKNKNTIFDDVRYEALPGAKQRFRFTNINSIKNCYKLVAKGLKDRFDKKQKEDDEELEDAMLTSGWFKGLGKLKPPILGDAFKEMYEGRDSAIDKRKTKEIDEFMKEPDEKGSSGSPGPSEYITKFLKKVADGDFSEINTPKKRRRAAGFYLYALSKGNPYFRAVSKFAGTGIWVKTILGPEYQQDYLKWYQNKLQYVQRNPWDAQAAEEIRSPELNYMKAVYMKGDTSGATPKLKADYGEAFFTKKLGQYEGMQYDTGLIDEAAKSAKWKGFDQLYNDDFFVPFAQLRMPDMIGTMEVMGEKIKGDMSAYHSWSMCLAMPILTGQHVSDMNVGYKLRYAKMARKFGSPFGVYALDTDGQKKLSDLFDVISGSDAAFTKTYGQRFDKPYKSWDFVNKIKPRWYSNGGLLLSYLNDPGKIYGIIHDLEKKKDGDGLSLEKKQELTNKIIILREYMNKKYGDTEKESIDGDIDGESVVYRENILGLNPGFVTSQMLNFSQGGYRGKTVESAPKLWKALTQKILSYGTGSQNKISPDLYTFILKRFIDYFGERWGYSGGKADLLMAAIKLVKPGETKCDLMTVAVTHNIDPQGNTLPSEVAECLLAFEGFFTCHRPDDYVKLKEVVKEAFGEEKAKRFDDLDASGAAPKTKNEIHSRDMAVVERYKKEKGVNFSIDRKERLFKDYAGNPVFLDGTPTTIEPRKVGKRNTRFAKKSDGTEVEFPYYDRSMLESLSAYQREQQLNTWDARFGDDDRYDDD